MQLAVSSPEWQYVNRAQVAAARATNPYAGRQTVRGTVAGIHPSGDDLFVNHDFNDLDIDVNPDAGYQNLAASANQGGIGLEWEAPLIPTWDWPIAGDRIQASGSWIWDCGHWHDSSPSDLAPYDPVETGNDLYNTQSGHPSSTFGEQTELHPLYEVATWRANAADKLPGYSTGRNISKLDVWVNGDGGPALQEEECALLGIPNSAVDRAACSRYRDVGGNYTYSIPLGPAPTSGSTIMTNVIDHPESGLSDNGPGGVSLYVTPNPSDNSVTVSFTLPHSSLPILSPTRYGVTVEAGWSDAPAAALHTVSLNELDVKYSLDGPSDPNLDPVHGAFPGLPISQQTVNPDELANGGTDYGEWVAYAAVNGQWRQFLPPIVDGSGNATPSKLSYVSDGQDFKNGQDFNQGDYTWSYWLPAGLSPNLYFSTRECNIPLIDCRREAFGAHPDPAHPFVEVGYNSHPGRITDLTNPDLPYQLGLGTSYLDPKQNNDFPHTADENRSDWTCANSDPTNRNNSIQGCYQLVVTAN